MKTEPIIDKHGRVHNYLRLSLTERCNLRCRYCMPEEGIDLSPKHAVCTYEELLELCDIFISLGVNKIRLTGGEPLVRKEVGKIIKELGRRPVELALTTNGFLVDRYISLFKEVGLLNINVSLDTLSPEKFVLITRREDFQKVYDNIMLLIQEGFNVKINMVLMRGINDDEIIHFAELARNLPVTIRFIEFMPFDGNRWSDGKMISAQEIRDIITAEYQLNRGTDALNDTTKHYHIPGFKGKIGIISSMSEHFCGSCNRIRLLSTGKIKNCLFSPDETDLLTPLREGYDIEPLIRNSIYRKKAQHAGMFNLAKRKNRSMITIGG